MAPRAKQKWPK